jgi:DNA-binding CsgD family transcriptional regulator/PAS domain-containing protein
MNEVEKLYAEYFELLSRQQFEEADLDYELLNKHIEFLRQMDALGDSAISIFDMNKKEHIFVSDNYSKMLGYDLAEVEAQGNSFFDSKVHPEDFLTNMKNGIELIKFAFSRSLEERKNYKLISEYRMKNGKGNYIRIIEQQQMLELDKKGNFWVALSTVDISPNQDLNEGVRAQIFNFRTKEIVPFSVTRKDKENNLLSKREKQILGLIKNGMLSKEIADKLFISVHTVNTHRQRILEKLNVSNSFEAIQYVSSLGITN